MRPHHVMFLGLIFVAGTLISLVMGGLWLETTDVDTTNSMAVMRPVDIGIMTIQVPNLEYFATGMAKMTTFDFAFISADSEGVYFLLWWLVIMIIGTATAWGIFVVMITIGSTLLGRR